jgi:hypothetical protein
LNPFGSATFSGFGIFAGTHREEECSQYRVRGVGLCGASTIGLSASKDLEEFLLYKELEVFEESRGDCFLTLRRRVSVIECLQEGLDGGE